MTPSPCFNRKTMTDCPKRTIHCKSTCPDWKAYEEEKRLEYAAREKQGNRSASDYEASLRLNRYVNHGRRKRY